MTKMAKEFRKQGCIEGRSGKVVEHVAPSGSAMDARIVENVSECGNRYHFENVKRQILLGYELFKCRKTSQMISEP